MTLSYTLHLKLAVPDFLSEPWHAEFAAAMDSIDRALYEGILVQGTALWANSTVYVIGAMVLSPDNGSIYVSSVSHTSSPAPQTFAQELAAFPSRWTAIAATQLATQAEAEAGVDNAKYMSPLRTRQAIIAQIGSSGQLLAFTSSISPPPTPHKGDFWYDLTTGILSAYIDDGNTLQWVAVGSGGGGSGFGLGVEPQGRLTLQTGVSVMVTNQAAKTTLFYTPHTGNQIPIWNGVGFGSTAFTELSVLTTDTTKNPAAIGASKVNDWFVWSDAGVVRLSHGIDWTNDTIRAAALSRVSGIWVNATAIPNGPGIGFGTYVGTTRSNASSQLDWIYGTLTLNGGAGFFGVWNCYNRVQVVSMTADTTDSWTYGTATWRAANNSATMRVSFVVGLQEDAFNSQYSAIMSVSVGGIVGVGYDVTNTFSGSVGYTTTATNVISTMAKYDTTPAIGFHFVSAIEQSFSGTTTFYGDVGLPAQFQTAFWFGFKM